MKLVSTAKEHVEQFVADHGGWVTVAQVCAYFGIQENFARRIGRDRAAKRVGGALVFDLAGVMDLAAAVREHECTCLKPKNVDQAIHHRKTCATPRFSPSPNGSPLGLVDGGETGKRYQIRVGRWGAYVRDTQVGTDMDLLDVIGALNRADNVVWALNGKNEQ